ncbi:MAG: hypothetical protein V1725_07130 [archaeon]
MRINLSKPRKAYFSLPKAGENIWQQTGKRRGSMLKGLHELEEQDRLVLLSEHSSLDDMLDTVRGGKKPSIDLVSNIERINTAGPDNLLLLPPQYRVTAEQKREALTEYRTLIPLFSAGVLEQLGKTEAQARTLHPDQVICTAFNLLHEKRDREIAKPYIAYSWNRGEQRILVFPFEAVKGFTQRIFQDFAAYKIILPEKEKRARELSRKRQLSRQESRELSKLEGQIAQYKKDITRYHLEDILPRLDVTKQDLIETEHKPYAQGHNWDLLVPSRSDPGKMHNVQILSYPATRGSIDPSAAWNEDNHCDCLDRKMNSNRRLWNGVLTKTENYECDHIIAGRFTALFKTRSRGMRSPPSPYIMPLRPLITLVDKLTYQAVIADAGSFRSLTEAEINRIIMQACIADGPEAYFTTSPNRLSHQAVLPKEYAITFTQ